MINVIRTTVLILLFFLALNAVGGGLAFIADPSGNVMQIPIDLLQNTPFKDYLIPGIILLVSNGILSLLVAILTLKKVTYYPWLIILQGCVLISWLTIELAININFFHPFLHYPLYVMGALFIAAGVFIQIRDENAL